jgi:allantoinase
MSRPSDASGHPPRDLIGYAASPPHPAWPGGAKLALNFVLNLEEGAERCILEGDATSENYLLEPGGRAALPGQRDWLSESMFEYGSRCGIWRLLKLFEERGISVTVWACGMALRRNPAVARHLTAHGHEIAGHGERWISYRDMPADAERAHIAKTIATIEELTGRKPCGWYTGRRSARTRELLVEAGIRYDSESYNDDLPYWISVQGRPHLVIPYSFDNNDAKYHLNPGWVSGEDFLSYLQNSVCCLYREGTLSPKMMTVALHARISGRPGRAEIVHRFLDFLAPHSDIWVATREQIALHWFQHHPYGEQEKEP